jgi:hypothetical protein
LGLIVWEQRFSNATADNRGPARKAEARRQKRAAGFYSGSVCLTAVRFSALVVASASLGAILGFVTAALFAVGGDR